MSEIFILVCISFIFFGLTLLIKFLIDTQNKIDEFEERLSKLEKDAVKIIFKEPIASVQKNNKLKK